MIMDSDGPSRVAGPNHGDPGPNATWPAIAAWRKTERLRLIEARLALPNDQRSAMTTRIVDGIDTIIGDPRGRLVSLYWPFRGEPDLRPWMAALLARGGRTALPIVVEKAKPLVFRSYRPGDRLEKGIWNIPVPAEGDPVLPDIVIAPLVGFDGEGYRLGYGGGFFDRTLAAMSRKPLIIGVGYDMQRMATIRPQAHDIAMDHIVTETARQQPSGSRSGGPGSGSGGRPVDDLAQGEG